MIGNTIPTEPPYTSTSNIISEREIEVLTLTSYGFSTQEIADQLYLSGDTIKTHRKNLMIKLKARNAAHLVRKGIEYQLIAS